MLFSNMVDKAGNYSLEFVNALNKRLSVLGTQAEKLNFVDVYVKLEGKNILDKILNNINELEKIEFLNNDGKIILIESRITQMVDSGQDYIQPSIKNLIAKKKVATLEENGHFIILIPVKIENDVAGYLVFNYSNNALLVQQNKSIEINIIFLIIFLIICILVSILISGKIAKPIFDLKRSAEKLEKGNLGVHIDTYTNDEVGELADTFNHMSDSLKKFDQMHVESEKEIQQKNRALRMLSNVNQALIHTIDERSLLDEVCKIIVKEGSYKLAWVGFAENDQTKTIRPVASAGFEAGYLETLDLTWEDSERGRGPTGVAVRTGKINIASDIATNPSMVPWREEALKRGYRSSIALPIINDEKVFGVISIYSGELNAFNDEEVKILDEMSKDLAFGITAERTNAEHKLLEEKINQLAEIVQSSDDAIIGKTLDGIITSWNKGAQKIYGYIESEVVGKPISILAPTSHKNDIPELLEKIKKGESVVHYETVRLKKDGTEIPVSLTVSPVVNAEGKLIGASTIGRDVTERKKKDEMLRIASAYNRRLIEISLDPLVTIGKDGKITDVNEATETVTGVPREQLVGDDFSNYFTEPKKADEGYKEVLKNGFVKDYPLTIKHTSGRTTDVLYNATVYKNEAGDIEGVFAAARDVTSLKLAEEELVRKNRNLRMLSDVNQALIHSTDEKLLLNKICNIVNAFGGYKMLWIGFREDDKEKTIRPVVFEGFESGFFESIQPTWSDTDKGRIPIGIAIRTGKTYIAQNISLAELNDDWRARALKRGYQSVISLPLSDGEQTFGAFSIFAEDINAFSEDEIKILEELANDLAFGITSLRINIKSKLLEEELLKASTDRYKALFVSSRDAIMTLEGPSWKFSSGNPTAIKMFGAKNEGDFLFHEPWNLSPKFQSDGQDSMEKARKMIDKAMEEGSNFFEWTHKRLNGEEFPAEVLLSRVEQDGKTFLHALVRDITERKKLDEKLKEYAEERFKAIFDNTNDGIILADLETKKFILGNTAFCEMLGYNSDEILKLGVTDIHPNEDLPNVFEQFEKQARKELKVAKDLRVKRKDGTVFYCDINSSPVTMNGKKYLIGIFRDTTERRNSEEKIRESEEQFRKIFENGMYGVILTGSDSKFFKVNPAFCKMLGYTEEELIGKKFSEITHAENIKTDTESVPKMISGEIPYYHTEKRYIKKNGQEIWVNLLVSIIRNSDGSFRYFLGMVEDITERKSIEQKLKESEELFHSIVTTMDEGIIFHNKKGEVTMINPAAEKILSLDSKEVIGKTLEQHNPNVKFIHEDGTVFLEKDHPAMVSLKTGRSQNDILFGIDNNRGSVIWISINAEPLFSNNDSEPYASVATFHDVTREKEIEKLRVDFLSLVSHQLRTPLSGTKWLIETIQRGVTGESNPKQKEYLETLYQINERMINLVSDILNVLTLESGSIKMKKEKVLVPKLYEDLSLIMDPAAKSKSILLRSALKNGEEFFIQSDFIVLRTILENFISNAICYSESGQEIVFDMSESPEETVFSVKDSGIGIPKDDKGRIFERFYRGSNAKIVKPGGSGLGLYTSSLLAKRIGAKITFESEENKGTTFYLHIPKKPVV
ncbi:MAG: PAS domain S-box protein [Candidatus Paceibacterota bacterium]